MAQLPRHIHLPSQNYIVRAAIQLNSLSTIAHIRPPLKRRSCLDIGTINAKHSIASQSSQAHGLLRHKNRISDEGKKGAASPARVQRETNGGAKREGA